MGHAHFVGIGEGQGDAEPADAAILADGVDLPAEVAAGLGHHQEEVVQAFSLFRHGDGQGLSRRLRYLWGF